MGCSVNLVIILGVMQVSKKIPFDDPMVLNGCRAAYVVSNLIILGIYLYIKSVVDKKKGMVPLLLLHVSTRPRRVR
jgi:hypothetical protein